MASYLILISSAPGTKNFDRAFSLAENIKENGNSITLFLIQDGVRAAVNAGAVRELPLLINSGVMCYLLEEDLRLRGFERGSLLPKVELVGYNELVELMASDSVTTLSVF
ncbi:MAG: DsrE family protein [Nitrospirae bacterium]|nr:DsrE family protein [Nitrospirota bacterium]